MNTFRILTAAGLFCLAGTAFGQQANLKGNIKGLGDGALNFHYYEG